MTIHSLSLVASSLHALVCLDQAGGNPWDCTLWGFLLGCSWHTWPALNLLLNSFTRIILLRSSNTGISFIWGIYIWIIFENYMKQHGSSRTPIDGLILYEQRVNCLNIPLILMQLLWISNLLPLRDLEDHISITALALTMQTVAALIGAQRAIGGLLIAILR